MDKSLRAKLESLGLAAGGGWLWSLAFGPEGSIWLPWIGLVPLVTIAGRESGRGRFLWGWLHGIVFWMTSIPWIVPTLVSYGGLPRALGIFLLGLLAAYLGVYHGLFALLGGALARRGAATALFALPALWVALEWLRGWLFGGFPWNLAAYAWIAMPGALEISAWIGAWGVSYLGLWVNVGIASSIRKRRAEPALLTALVVLLVLPIAGRYSRPGPAAAPKSEVVLLQPNTGVDGGSDQELWLAYLEVVEQAAGACRERPALLIWPESAAWPFMYGRSPRLERDLAELAAAGCPVILNTVSHGSNDRGDGAEGMYNSAILVDEEGLAGRYDKRKLVPWGEHVPLAEVLPFVGKLARQAGNFSAGDSVALLPWEGGEIGMAICYEVVFPHPVAEQVRAGAPVLATITNDAWYGASDAPWQHFRAARFRAAENHRPLLRSALTGVSGVIGPRGEVIARLGVGEKGVLRHQVVPRSGLTPFARAPWLVPGACLLGALLPLGFAIVRRRRK